MTKRFRVFLLVSIPIIVFVFWTQGYMSSALYFVRYDREETRMEKGKFDAILKDKAKEFTMVAASFKNEKLNNLCRNNEPSGLYKDFFDKYRFIDCITEKTSQTIDGYAVWFQVTPKTGYFYESTGLTGENSKVDFEPEHVTALAILRPNWYKYWK